MTQPTQEVLLRKFAIEQAMKLPGNYDNQGSPSAEKLCKQAEVIYTFCAKGLPPPAQGLGGQ